MRKRTSVPPSTGWMQLKSQVLALMRMPNEDGLTVAGPAFEYDPVAIRTR